MKILEAGKITHYGKFIDNNTFVDADGNEYKLQKSEFDPAEIARINVTGGSSGGSSDMRGDSFNGSGGDVEYYTDDPINSNGQGAGSSDGEGSASDELDDLMGSQSGSKGDSGQNGSNGQSGSNSQSQGQEGNEGQGESGNGEGSQGEGQDMGDQGQEGNSPNASGASSSNSKGSQSQGDQGQSGEQGGEQGEGNGDEGDGDENSQNENQGSVTHPGKYENDKKFTDPEGKDYDLKKSEFPPPPQPPEGKVRPDPNKTYIDINTNRTYRWDDKAEKFIRTGK